ncbi:MAG: VWA domain-containing protein [Pseudobdellovibrio sp.]|nr:VWA domain-containing protein [Pseudobdellovibrio sp.]
MSVLRWGNTSAFGFLILLAVWVLLYFYFEKTSEKKLNEAFGKKVVPWLRASVSFPKRRLQLVLQVIGGFFLILALARPQMGQSEQEVKSEGVELMIVADVSDSMLAEDVKPSRLQQMKIDLAKLMDLMPGNKTGLIAFAGSAALMSPLTSDPGALKLYIDSLDTYSVSTQGTAFEPALSFAKEAFEKGGVTQSPDLKTTRVILVASDGEDQEEGALEAAKALAKDGAKIITVAYGTEKGGTIPTRDPFGNLTGSKKDKDGNVIFTTVKGEFLKSLAEAGEGSFYFASFDGSHLKQIAEDVSHYEKALFDSSMIVQYDEKFAYPLGLGILILLFSLLITDRKKEPIMWKGRYEY